MKQAVIDIQGIGMTYTTMKGEKVTAIEHLELEAHEGEFISLVGPSGCGKTTLLRIISGLLKQTRGKVLLNGNPVEGPSPEIAIVFQHPVLLDWRTILNNVLLPIEIQRRDTKQYLKQAQMLMELCGLLGFENKSPRELSGGMQQRACICRALITNPAVLLMDEPFGALDAFTRDQMNLELLRIWRGESEIFAANGGGGPRKTILFITHSISEAVFLSDRVGVLTRRPSRLMKSYDIPFPRPRTPDIIRQREFGEIVFAITEDIKSNF